MKHTLFGHGIRESQNQWERINVCTHLHAEKCRVSYIQTRADDLVWLRRYFKHIQRSSLLLLTPSVLADMNAHTHTQLLYKRHQLSKTHKQAGGPPQACLRSCPSSVTDSSERARRWAVRQKWAVCLWAAGRRAEGERGGPLGREREIWGEKGERRGEKTEGRKANLYALQTKANH